jgi:hypothetical protein
LRPGNECEVRLKGIMYEISYSPIGFLFANIGRLCGALVPYQGKNIAIRLDIRTHMSDPRFMYWQRVHFFPRSPEYLFRSRMEYLEGNEFIERVRLGLGMRMRATLIDGVLKFEAVCYQWDIFGICIRFPNWLLLGTGTILERQVSPDQFEMFFEINHPWWGRTFTYTGIFSIESNNHAVPNDPSLEQVVTGEPCSPIE